MIDVHTNGAADALFNRDQGNAVAIASIEYARNGATGFVAGVMTAPFESMLHAAYEIVESAHQLDEHGVRGARCLGIHFEGPFLNPKFRRVHRHEWLLPASAERAREMVDACMGACVLVTMAPEVDGVADALRVVLRKRRRLFGRPHGLALSRRTAGDRARIPFAHPRVQRHAAAGSSRSVDSRGVHAGTGRTFVQLICDGFHVAPVMVDVLHRMLGDRIVLSTDNMPPADPGYYIADGLVRNSDGTIAGSALRIDDAVRNYMSYAQIPFAQAVVAATHAPPN